MSVDTERIMQKIAFIREQLGDIKTLTSKRKRIHKKDREKRAGGKRKGALKITGGIAGISGNAPF